VCCLFGGWFFFFFLWCCGVVADLLAKVRPVTLRELSLFYPRLILFQPRLATIPQTSPSIVGSCAFFINNLTLPRATLLNFRCTPQPLSSPFQPNAVVLPSQWLYRPPMIACFASTIPRYHIGTCVRTFEFNLYLAPDIAPVPQPSHFPLFTLQTPVSTLVSPGPCPLCSSRDYSLTLFFLNKEYDTCCPLHPLFATGRFSRHRCSSSPATFRHFPDRPLFPYLLYAACLVFPARGPAALLLDLLCER